jgi:hypothetical protein
MNDMIFVNLSWKLDLKNGCVRRASVSLIAISRNSPTRFLKEPVVLSMLRKVLPLLSSNMIHSPLLDTIKSIGFITDVILAESSFTI